MTVRMRCAVFSRLDGSLIEESALNALIAFTKGPRVRHRRLTGLRQSEEGFDFYGSLTAASRDRALRATETGVTSS